MCSFLTFRHPFQYQWQYRYQIFHQIKTFRYEFANYSKNFPESNMQMIGASQARSLSTANTT